MEVSGTVLREVTCPSISRHVPSSRVVPGGGCVKVSVRPRRTVMMGSSCGFRDEGHVLYYEDKKKKGTAMMLSTKKKLKMLKGLSKGLSLFPELGIALDPDKQPLFEDLQGKLTSDAAEVLMKQLEQLRVEEKELKRKKKQEKKAKLKASKMDCESSSSSSESSDSNCDCDQVVDMNSMRASVAVAVAVAPSTAENQLQPPALKVATMLSPPPALLPKTDTIVENPPKDDASSAHHHDAMELCSGSDTCVSSISLGLIKNESAVVTTTAPAQKRIEVCMGNKCKKSGAPALLQEFERVVGVERGAVVACKCMGKCKSAPNVRIQNSVDSLAEGLNDSVKVPANPLCIGVALEDVEAIVARFLGEENQGDMGIAAAAT